LWSKIGDASTAGRWETAKKSMPASELIRQKFIVRGLQEMQLKLFQKR
jgi:hypothetical protein